MNSGNDSSQPNKRGNADKDVPAECAAFERLLATIAGDFGEAKPEQFDEVMAGCLQKLVEFIGFDRGTIMLFCEEDEKQQLTVTHCWAREGVPRAAKGMTLNEDLWYVHQIKKGHIVRISTAADWPAEASADRTYISEYGIKSTLSVPLIIGGTVVGVSSFGTFHTERSWSKSMVARLRLVGEIIALGIRRKRDSEELTALAQEMGQQSSERNERMRRLAFGLMRAENEERIRISELLHEDVMQTIALVGMYIEGVQKEDWGNRLAAISHMKELTRAVLDKLRNLVKELRLDVLSNSGVVEGLRWQARKMRQTANLSVDVKVYDDLEHASQSKDLQLFIYRAVGRLLENVAMHSQTNRARLEIRRDGSQTKITVSDNGVGFDQDSLEYIPSRSFGLFSIREQAELLGGELEVASSSGHGTRVTLTVPDSPPSGESPNLNLD